MALFYKPFRLSGIVLCAVFLLFSATAQAETSLFVIDDVKMDITAQSASEAKKQAFEQAQTKAFETLVARMLTDDEIVQLPPAEPREVSLLIKDFEITDEKLSSVRYMATYKFRFKEKEVRQYFTNLGFGFSDLRSEPMLILPLYRKGFDTILWSYDNEWLRAWNRSGDINGLVPITVPIGDLDDVQDIGDDDALTYTKEGMSKMLERYGAHEAVIAIAIPNAGFDIYGNHAPNDSGGINIQIFRTDRNTPEFTREIHVNVEPDDTRDQVFDRAVHDVYKALQRDWKVKTRVDTNEDNQITARVPITSLKEWADTQKVLKNVSAINNITVKKLSPQGALIDIKFQGRITRLQSVLREVEATLNITPSPEPEVKSSARTRIFGSTEWGQEPTESEYKPVIIHELYLNRYAPVQVNKNLKPIQ